MSDIAKQGGERKFLLGTERKLDYLVVAERNGIALALKPVMTTSRKFGMHLSYRIRTALLPSAPQSVKASQPDWAAVWPEIAFDQISAERASAVVLIPTGVMPWFSSTLGEMIGTASTVAVDFVKTRIEDFCHDPHDAAAFMIEGWKNDLAEFAKAMPDKAEVVPDGPVAHYVTDLFPKPAEGSMTPQKAVQKIAKGFEPKVVEGGKTSDFAEPGKPAGKLTLVNNEKPIVSDDTTDE